MASLSAGWASGKPWNCVPPPPWGLVAVPGRIGRKGWTLAHAGASRGLLVGRLHLSTEGGQR